MGAYGSQPQTPGAAPIENGQYAPHGATPNGGGAAAQPSVQLTMKPMTEEEEEPIKDAEAALKKLVNFDRIDEQPDYGRKLTMMKEEEKKKKTKNGKSVPLPPVGSGMIGQNASLQQISSVKDVSVRMRGGAGKPLFFQTCWLTRLPFPLSWHYCHRQTNHRHKVS